MSTVKDKRNGQLDHAEPAGSRTLTREHFRQQAEDIIAVLNNKQTVTLEVKEFKTGSLGWYANGKVTLDVGGVRVKAQIGFNLTIVGSKELPS